MMQPMQISLPNWQDMVDYGKLGARLRDVRRKRRWTLERAASLSKLSASTISRIETNQRTPSLEHLVALCSAYGVALADLLPSEMGDPRVRSKSRRTGGMTIRELSPPESMAAVVEITLKKRSGPGDPQTHAGHEWVYVVSGILALTLGSQEILMREGEAAEFDTRSPHALRAESDYVTLIAIFSEEGRRIHLRA